jgi:holo-[acyl-carrier protein] synthase
MSIRVGIDLVNVEQVTEAIAEHGDRYLNRIYTERELSDAGSVPQRLAARFAAKEATMKALGRGQEGLGWKRIAVEHEPGGQPRIALTGSAAELARERGIQSIQVSLTHEPDYAAAMVVMECQP